MIAHDVVRAHPDRLRVVGLAAGANAEKLLEQATEFQPKVIAMATEDGLQSVAAGYRAENGLAGSAGLVAVATHPDVDIVICASSGTAGLEAVLAAIDAGKTIALANKEVLVMAGALVTAAARRRGVAILPVDSEHNAIHQCLHGRRREEVRRIILTASGGPFRQMPASRLAGVKPAEALQHPTWRMGRKITIDSATLMNKGLEVIEAHWLFDLPASRIDVLIHPQSVVHSMVEMVDGSIIAQLGVTDMRLPIQYAFSYPDRWATPLPPLDLTRCGKLEFEMPDTGRFPCLRLAFRALEGDAGLPVVLNAANEVAVAAFLKGTLAFTAIPEVIGCAMDAHERNGTSRIRNLDDVRVIDGWARTFAGRSAGGLQ